MHVDGKNLRPWTEICAAIAILSYALQPEHGENPSHACVLNILPLDGLCVCVQSCSVRVRIDLEDAARTPLAQTHNRFNLNGLGARQNMHVNALHCAHQSYQRSRTQIIRKR